MKRKSHSLFKVLHWPRILKPLYNNLISAHARDRKPPTNSVDDDSEDNGPVTTMPSNSNYHNNSASYGKEELRKK